MPASSSSERLTVRAFAGPDPPLVFLSEHGFSATLWRSIGDRLRAQHAALEIDLLGTGEARPSERSASGSEDNPYGPAAQASTLWHEVVRPQELAPFLLFGVGYGAAIAEEFAARLPDTLLGVVLVNPLNTAITRWRAVAESAAIEELVVSATPAVRQQLEACREAEADSWRRVDAALRTEVHSGDEHILHVPVLAIAGDRAPFTSTGPLLALRREWPQLSVAVLNHVAHFPMLEAPDTFVAAVERFKEHLRRPHHATAPGAWASTPECVWPDDPLAATRPLGEPPPERSAPEDFSADW